MYSQVVYCLDRVPAVVKAKPELAKVEPFKTVMSGNREAIAKLSMEDLEKILAATLTGMSVDEFNAEVKKWLATAKDPRWKRPYTELTYLPMQEVLKYLRANGYKTYIVTGGGQDFVRVYSEQTYGIPPEQVVGTAGGTKYGYDKDGKPILTKEPKLLLNDNNAGKPEGIHLMIGRRPVAAFGNSTGDQQMLEYTKAGDGARLAMLVLHDDAKREYAYGPAQGLPDTKVGAFTPGALRRGEEAGLDRDQHEERLEADLRVRSRPSGGGALVRMTLTKLVVSLCAAALWAPAIAQRPGEEAQHPRHLGRRHRLVQRQRLQQGRDGLQDAQHRSHREGRRALHRLVRAAELHRRPRRVHHRAVADPHRPDRRWDCPART